MKCEFDWQEKLVIDEAKEEYDACDACDVHCKFDFPVPDGHCLPGY